MPTEKQIEAARRNGAKSRGPVTAGGKANSSQNAIKHGILAKAILIKGESEESFIAHVADLFDHFHPANPVEEALVESMAAARWREERVWHIESSTFNLQMDRELSSAEVPQNSRDLMAKAHDRMANESRSLDLIIRYQSSLALQYLRAHKRLIECQAARLKSGPDQPPPGPNVIPIDSPQPVDSAPDRSQGFMDGRPCPSVADAFTKRTQQPVETKQTSRIASLMSSDSCPFTAQQVFDLWSANMESLARPMAYEKFGPE